jgi:hypothetical protein
MTFVELVERLRMECGVSGPTIETVQGSLPREIARLKAWTITAWDAIQRKHPDWVFMRLQSSTTIPQYGSALAITEHTAGTVASWVADTMRIGADGGTFADSIKLPCIEYESWRVGEGLVVTPYAKPTTIAIRQRDKALFVAPAADVAYKLYFDYQRTPIALSADADLPAAPARFHMAIVARAMMMYGRYEAAPEVLLDGREQYKEILAELEIDQLPPTTIPGGEGDAWQ